MLFNLPNRHTKGFVDYFTNDWSLNSAFQAQSGLPYSAVVNGGYTSSYTLNTGLTGAGGASFIPALGRNTYKYKRDLLQDLRVNKQIHITERFSAEARADLYNLYNHQNVTGVNNTAFNLTSTGVASGTATYQSSFGTVTNSNSSGFLYNPTSGADRLPSVVLTALPGRGPGFGRGPPLHFQKEQNSGTLRNSHQPCSGAPMQRLRRPEFFAAIGLPSRAPAWLHVCGAVTLALLVLLRMRTGCTASCASCHRRSNPCTAPSTRRQPRRGS